MDIPGDKIIHLQDADPNDKARLGNKGANLALMYQMGLPVPEAYIVPAVPRNEIPWYGIWQAFDKLGGCISVRSSPPVSMPGICETFLFVRNPVGLLHVFDKVYESINSPRAAKYREMRKLPIMRIAVVLQKMIKAQISGVVFTADPITRLPDLIGEFKIGTGEDLVLGRITPIPLSQLKRRWLLQLGDYAWKLVLRFGKPQDIEFCIDENGKIWLLQTRDMKFRRKRGVSKDNQ